MASNDAIAPFIMKIYQMVDDSSSDNLIRWGNSDNSFIVVDSLHFSRCLLPAFFKHSNFSSFICQLNSYGFKKVDPDRCEFANECFLRGQIHLLKNIRRRKQSNCRGNFDNDEDEIQMAMEIARLKQEQKELKKEMLKMNKRLEATERRPKQIMALVCLVAEDPQIMPRMMLETERKRLVVKRQRMLQKSPAAASGMVKCEEDEVLGIGESLPVGEVSWRRCPMKKAGGGDADGSVELDFIGRPVETEVRPPPPYPFSLFGGGF